MSKQTHIPKRLLTEPLRLMFDPDAHRQLEAHCNESAKSEVCGVLVGFTGVDGANRWTRVVSVIRGRHAREEQMSVTFTHETWEAVHDELSRREDKARVVGWYHTHPDFGIFYSAPDVFVHRNFFGLEGQVGVVVDPIRGERGVFANTTKGLQTLHVYEVARHNKHGHLVDCTYVDDPLRDAFVEARAAGELHDADLHRTLRASLDPIEAGFARFERQMSLMFWLVVLWMPLAAILAFAAGSYLGGRPPGAFVTLDLDGQPIRVVMPALGATASDQKAVPKLSEGQFKLISPATTQMPADESEGKEPEAGQGGKK